MPELVQITDAQRQIEEAQAAMKKEETDWQLAEKFYEKNIPALYLPSGIKEKVQMFERGQVSTSGEIAQQRFEYREQKAKVDAQITQLKQQGFEPVYVKGQVTGFTDVQAGKSVPLQTFEKYYNETRPSTVQAQPVVPNILEAQRQPVSPKEFLESKSREAQEKKITFEQKVTGVVPRFTEYITPGRKPEEYLPSDTETIYERQLGIKDKIPEVEYVYRRTEKVSTPKGITDREYERRATPGEIQLLESQSRVLKKTREIPIISPAIRGVKETYGKVEKNITETPIIEGISKGYSYVMDVTFGKAGESQLSYVGAPGILTGKGTSLGKQDMYKFEEGRLKPITYQQASINEAVQQAITEPFIFRPLERIGVNKESIYEITKESLPPIFPFRKKVGSYLGGIVSGIYQDIREKPVKQFALFGVAKGAGLAFGGIKDISKWSVQLQKESLKAYDTKTTKILSEVLKPGKIATAGRSVTSKLITGMVAYDLGKTALTSTSFREAGEKVGVSLKDLGIFAKGFSIGEKAARKPILTTKLKEKVDITYFEPQYSVIKGEEEKIMAQYKIEKTVYPREVEVTTAIRKALRADPIAEQVPVGGIRKGITETAEFSEIGKDFLVKEITPRSKQLLFVRGASVNVDLKSVYPKGLEPIDKRLVEEFAGKVPEKFVTKVLSKGSDFTIGEVETEKFFKGKRKEEFTMETFTKGIVPEGKRIVRARYLAETKEMPTKEGYPFEVYKGRVKFRDITFPTARAAGKIGEMKGFTIRLKEPLREPLQVKDLTDLEFKKFETKINFPTEKDITLYHGTSDIYLDKIMKEGLKTAQKTGIYQGIAQAPKEVYLTKDLEAAKGYAGRTIVKAGGKPIILEIKGLKVKSEFGRLGETKVKSVSPKFIKIGNIDRQILQQKTELISLPKIVPKVYGARTRMKQIEPTMKNILRFKEPLDKSIRTISTRSILSVKSSELPSLKEKAFTLERLGQRPGERLIEKTMPQFKYVEKEILMEKVREKLIEKPMERYIEKELLKSQPRLMLKEQLKQAQKYKQKQLYKERSITMPTPYRYSYKTKPPKPPKLDFDWTSKSISSLTKGFDVFVIEKKKPRVIARGLSKSQALDIGAKATLGGLIGKAKALTATFGIRESKEPLMDIETGREFAKYRNLFREPLAKSRYKKYGTVFVQRKEKVSGFGGRLAFKEERAEIQSARLNKAANYIR